MKALVVFDSVFGNTAKIAQAIGDAITSQGDVRVVKISEVDPEQLEGLDYLFVGSPTRAFSPTPAIKSFLNGLGRQSLEGVKVAAFDTRADLSTVNSRILEIMVKFFGYAAEPIAKRMTRKGGEMVIAPEGFLVLGTEGPLGNGELERAALWALTVTQS